MSTFRGTWRPVSDHALAWSGFGAAALALAFAVHPVHASRTVFWMVVTVGAIAIALGCGVLIRGILPHQRFSGRGGARQRQLLAAECHRLHDALATFIAERNRVRPRKVLRVLDTSRVEDWRADTVRLYGDEFRDWALRVFDEVVASEVVLASPRRLVQAPAPNQLDAVRDLFRDAAHTLEDI